MSKHIARFILAAFLIESCAPMTASPTLPPTATVIESSTQLFAVTLTADETPPISDITSFSIKQIRTPSDTDGRQVLTAFWSMDGMAIYYALVDEIANPPLWFEISLESGQDFQKTQLSSLPKLNYTPFLPIGGMYLEYQGLISPSGRYQFQIIQAENDSLSLFDNKEQSKFKILETSDMNFRGAYWMPGEDKVVFGIGPEYGTELYHYDIGERKLSSFADLFGYKDPNISEWALSPNGKYVAILDGNQNLKLFSLDDNFSATLPGYSNNIRWAGNSQKIFHYSGTEIYEPTGIVYFDMTVETTVNVILVSEFEKLRVRGFFDVSPDGTQLVFWQAGNIWLMSFE